MAIGSSSFSTPWWAMEIGRAAWRGRVEISVAGVQTCALTISGTPWLMAFTQGVPEALAVKDGDRLQQLLYPLVVNGNVHFLTAVDAQGQEIISLVQDPAAGT